MSQAPAHIIIYTTMVGSTGLTGPLLLYQEENSNGVILLMKRCIYQWCMGNMLDLHFGSSHVHYMKTVNDICSIIFFMTLIQNLNPYFNLYCLLLLFTNQVFLGTETHFDADSAFFLANALI